MASSAPTILDLKTTFLRAQTLLLSQPCRPSAAFTASNASDEKNALRQKAIDDALLKLNHQVKQHNKLAYGPQVQRHVAEQVDRLYWNAGERGLRLLGAEDGWAERGSDYRKDIVIEQLPEEWESTKAPEQAAKFTELSRKLAALNEQRRIAKERVERYRRFKEMVGLLGEDAGVQDNLVTRNGEVEAELEKMRRLILRVERGVAALEGRGQEVEMDVDIEGEAGEEAKILDLLSGGV